MKDSRSLELGKVDNVVLTDRKNILHKGFNHTKKVAIYTPPNYDPSKKYGVLYMFDAQNLFIKAEGHASTNIYGCWMLDEEIAKLVKMGDDGIIIAAIDNGDRYRERELVMDDSFGEKSEYAKGVSFNNGFLDRTFAFLLETLIPYVKANYSIDDVKAKTGIAGSSLGGLAAYYCGMKRPDLFGYIGAFSPAVCLFSNKAWNDFHKSTVAKNVTNAPKVFIYCGFNDNGLEDDFILGAKQIAMQLKTIGYKEDQLDEIYADQAIHHENWWNKYFTAFLNFGRKKSGNS